MLFVTIEETAAKWGITTRQVRTYCASGRIPGATLVHGEWRIPADAVKPERKSRRTFPTTILGVLEAERTLNWWLRDFAMLIGNWQHWNWHHFHIGNTEQGPWAQVLCLHEAGRWRNPPHQEGGVCYWSEGAHSIILHLRPPFC